MKFRLHRENGALNSPPVFDAFEQGLKKIGHDLSEDHDAIPVIWSVLWNGRMLPNKQIYFQAIKNKKPIIIIEVGNLKRGESWRISVNHINRLGFFGNHENLDPLRVEKFDIQLKEYQTKRKSEILIACQHQRSLQWENMPPIDAWVQQTVEKIRNYSDRKIIVRAHPRSPVNFKQSNIVIDKPQRILGTYDGFNIDYRYHCVINHNSGVPIQAAIEGVPIICDQSSLAYPVSMEFKDIETPILKDRKQWIEELVHTEWFIDEIAEGIPLKRLENYLF